MKYLSELGKGLFILFILINTGCTNDIPPDADDPDSKNLVLYYSFDESTGIVAKDLTVNHYDGNISNASRVQAKSGNGLQFEYTGAKVVVPLTPAKFTDGQLTISSWINLTQADSAETYRIFGSYNFHDIAFQIKNSKLEILFDGILYLESTQILETNKWIHVAFTSDGSDICFYIDGTEDRSLNIVFPFKINVGPLQIGATNILGGDIDEFKGIIDEFKIWNISLSKEQIEAEYTKYQ